MAWLRVKNRVFGWFWFRPCGRSLVRLGLFWGGRGGEDEEGSEGREGDDLRSDDFHFSRQTRLESLRLVGYSPC